MRALSMHSSGPGSGPSSSGPGCRRSRSGSSRATSWRAGCCCRRLHPLKLACDPQAATVFVVDEVTDPAASIPPKPRFPVVFDRSERIRPPRGQDIPLAAGLAHEDVGHPTNDDRLTRALVESVFADQLVEHAVTDAPCERR